MLACFVPALPRGKTAGLVGQRLLRQRSVLAQMSAKFRTEVWADCAVKAACRVGGGGHKSVSSLPVHSILPRGLPRVRCPVLSAMRTKQHGDFITAIH